MVKFCWFLIILDLDFPHERDHGEAILCKGGVAKHIFLKFDAADVLVGIKCDLCALTWEGKLMVMASLQSQREQGKKKAQTHGVIRGKEITEWG